MLIVGAWKHRQLERVRAREVALAMEGKAA
jgi:hypothetical protein